MKIESIDDERQPRSRRPAGAPPPAVAGADLPAVERPCAADEASQPIEPGSGGALPIAPLPPA